MLYRISVWVHIVAACFWVGGILFFAVVLVPVLRKLPGPSSVEFVRAIGTRFRVAGWWSVALLVATGLVNLLSRYPGTELAEAAFWLSPFGQALTLKLALVAIVVVASIGHDVLGVRATNAALRDPGSADAVRLRMLASWLGRLDAVLVLAIVFVAVVLVRGW